MAKANNSKAAERAHPKVAGYRVLGGKLEVYGQYMLERYAWANQFVKGKVVLDAPTGVGWGASTLSVASKIFGLDICEEAILYGRIHYKNVIFVVGNMTNMPFGDSKFDVVSCLDGYEHVTKTQQYYFLLEVSRCLKPNGTFVVTVPTGAEALINNPYHLHVPTKEEFYCSVSEFFLVEYVEEKQVGHGGISIRAALKLR